MAKSIKRNLIKVLLAVLLPALLTVSLVSYAPVPVFKMQEANALAPFKMLLAAGGAGSVEVGEAGDEIGYSFDGTLDALTLADHANWDLIADTTNYTIDLWVRHTDHVSDEQYIGQSADTGNFWKLHHANANGIRFTARIATVAIIATPYGGEITDSNFHHVALIKIADEYGCYLDGQQVNYVQDTSTTTYAGPLNIGITVTNNPFDGEMDEIRIYQGNPFGGAPNVGLTDTITPNETLQYLSDASTFLLIHCGETKSGTTGSNATFTESGTDGLTVTEVDDAIEDAVNFKF